MIVERFPPDIGGSGMRFWKIAERLSQKHTVEIFTVGSSETYDATRSFCIHRFDSSTLPILKSHGLNRVIGLSFSTFFQLLFRSYDIIDVDIWPILPFFSVKTAEPSTPAVISWNVVWPFSFQRTISVASTVLAKTCSKLCTHNITVSNSAKTVLLKHVRMNPEKVSVIPNGSDEALSKAKLQPKWGRIIFVGRLEPQKRLDLILEAFKIFKRTTNDAELHIIGSGPLESQLLRASEKTSGLYLHKFIPASSREELISMLSESWVFASASEFETYGMSISEASSIGLPAVLTRAPHNGAVDEIVKHESNGLIVDHNKPKAMADAFERLFEDHELWERLSHNARKLAPSHSWDDVAKQVEAVYEKVLSRRLPIENAELAT